MKRFVAVMAFLSVMCAGCYGAEQADSEVYVRKEVFNAYIDSVNTKMDRILEELRSLREELKATRNELKATREELKGDINAVRQELKGEINTLREEIKSLRKDLDSVIRAVAVLAQRVDNLEVRMGDLRNDIYLGLVVFGIIFSLPSVQKFLAQRESRKPLVTPENTSLTAEDVKRLIMETLAEMKQHGA